MPRKHLYVLAYDVAEDRRRTKFAKYLENQGGERVNYSVFELILTQKQYRDLQTEIADRIDHKKDRVVLYPVCKSCYAKSLFLPNKGMDPPRTLIEA